MIITQLHDGQGLGNQLWCYTASRSIAEYLGMPFGILGKEKFKANNFLNLDFGHYDDAHEIVSRQVGLQYFNELRFYDRELDYISSFFDNRVCALKGNILLNGLFQSEKYFFDDYERPKEYINIIEGFKDIVTFDNNTCVLNIRGGEYKRYQRFILPKEYWINAMNNMSKLKNIKKFVIVTDDYKYAKKLFPNIEIIPQGIAESYIAIHNAENIIVSNSTFSYFPIATKTHKPFVIAPKYFARHNSKLNRWASIANIYKDWYWQDKIGELTSYDKCMDEVQNTMNLYEQENYILVNEKTIKKQNFRELFPVSLRANIKRFLSHINPLKYG